MMIAVDGDKQSVFCLHCVSKVRPYWCAWHHTVKPLLRYPSAAPFWYFSISSLFVQLFALVLEINSSPNLSGEEVAEWLSVFWGGSEDELTMMLVACVFAVRPHVWHLVPAECMMVLFSFAYAETRFRLRTSNAIAIYVCRTGMETMENIALHVKFLLTGW